MKKNIGILFCILLISSCYDKNSYRTFVSLSKLSNYENGVRKPLLIKLINEKNDADFFIENTLLTNNFICYVAHDSKECVFSKIIPNGIYPLYIIFSSDTITSFFSCDEMKQILENVTEKQLYSAMLESDFTMRKKDDIMYLNVLLKLYKCIEEGENGSFAGNINNLEALISQKNEFYGKYLLAQFFKSRDAIKTEEIYTDLWVNSKPEEMKKYPEEFLDILKNKNRITLIENRDINFVCTEHDFGVINLTDKVICRFYYTNNSNRKFVIHNIVTTCGCTVPFWNRQPIVPNGQDSISVEFSPNSVGHNNKTIVIEGNCRQKIELKIKALVRE